VAHWGYDGWWQEDLTHAPLSPMPREEVGFRACTPPQPESPAECCIAAALASPQLPGSHWAAQTIPDTLLNPVSAAREEYADTHATSRLAGLVC
jgi:hypothetical protein